MHSCSSPLCFACARTHAKPTLVWAANLSILRASDCHAHTHARQRQQKKSEERDPPPFSRLDWDGTSDEVTSSVCKPPPFSAPRGTRFIVTQYITHLELYIERTPRQLPVPPGSTCVLRPGGSSERMRYAWLDIQRGCIPPLSTILCARKKDILRLDLLSISNSVDLFPCKPARSTMGPCVHVPRTEIMF